MKNQVEAAYAERNRLVSALTKLYPASVYRDGVWSAVYIELPTGQVSWHFDGRPPLPYAEGRSGGVGHQLKNRRRVVVPTSSGALHIVDVSGQLRLRTL